MTFLFGYHSFGLQTAPAPAARDLSPATFRPRLQVRCPDVGSPVVWCRFCSTGLSLFPLLTFPCILFLLTGLFGAPTRRGFLYSIWYSICVPRIIVSSFRVYLYILQTAVFALLIKIRFLLSCLFLTVTEKGDEKNIRKKIFLQYLALQHTAMACRSALTRYNFQIAWSPALRFIKPFCFFMYCGGKYTVSIMLGFVSIIPLLQLCFMLNRLLFAARKMIYHFYHSLCQFFTLLHHQRQIWICNILNAARRNAISVMMQHITRILHAIIWQNRILHQRLLDLSFPLWWQYWWWKYWW